MPSVPPQLVTAMAVFALGLGVFLLVRAWRSFARAEASEGWPVTQGQVLSSEVVPDDPDAPGRYCRPRIVYRYRVGEHDYTGDLIAFGTEQVSWTRWHAEEWTAGRPAGSTVPVHYDPDDPQRSVLDAGVRWETFLPLAGGLASLALGAYFAFR